MGHYLLGEPRRLVYSFFRGAHDVQDKLRHADVYEGLEGIAYVVGDAEEVGGVGGDVGLAVVASGEDSGGYAGGFF